VTSGDLVEAPRDPDPEALVGHEGRAVNLRARQHVVGAGARFETGMEVDEGRGTGAPSLWIAALERGLLLT